jgi:limonene-1,2-epoxide hydrolase
MQQLQSSVPQPSSIQVVERFFDAWRAMDLSGVLELVSDDIVYHNGPFAPLRGKARAERVFSAYCRAADTFEIEIHNIAERNGVVLTERTDRAIGRWIDMTFWICGTFEVRDGKIVFWRDYFDQATVTLQLIASPFRRLAARLTG